MSQGITEKQRAFAKLYVETQNACEAYRRAYDAKDMSDKAIGIEATRLKANPRVALEIASLHSGTQERHDITIDKLTSMALAAYDMALTETVAQPSAAISAVLAIGKLHGLVVDKKEVTRKRDATDLTLDELYAIAGMGRAGDHSAPAGTGDADSVH